MLRTAITLGVFISIHCSAFAQLHFVQFIVHGIENEEQCRWLEEIVRLNSGFESVRAESHSKNFLAFIHPEFSYTKEDFETWLAELGYELRCFHTGVAGQDIVLRLREQDCGEELPKPED